MIAISACLMALLGFLGDRYELSYKIRLLGQLIICFTFVLYSKGVPSGFDGLILLLFWVIFIVGTSNIYNFMDGINGIAGITGVVACLLIAILGIKPGKDFSLLILSIGLGTSCLGFLPFNFFRARVFMGDVGSILIGAAFAILIFRLTHRPLEFLTLAAYLLPFYADELTTVFTRLKLREKLVHPHRRHVYQILANELKVPHVIVSLGYGILQLLIGVSVSLMGRKSVAGLILLVISYFFSLVGIGYFIRSKVKIEKFS
jgi:Fuc2NAc and GlcNAc transferase